MIAFNRKVRAIAWREFSLKIRSRWFLISTVLVPLLVVGSISLASWLGGGRGGAERPLHVGLVDRTGRGIVLPDTLFARASVADDTLTVPLPPRPLMVIQPAPEAAGRSDQELRQDLIGLRSVQDGFLILPAGFLAGDSASRLLSRENVGPRREQRLEDALQAARVRARLQAAGVSSSLDVDSLLRPASVRVVKVSERSSGAQDTYQILAMALMVVMYMILIFYGQMIVRAVLEEKTSDLVEIMVSSVRPWEMMLGKMIGVGGVGLLQVGIWILFIVGTAIYGLLTGGAAALSKAGIDLGALRVIDVGWSLLLLGFFLGGYMLYASLFTAAGAMLSREEDAQQVMFPLFIPLILAFMLAQPLIASPGASWVPWVTLVPLVSPMLMPVRMTVSVVPAWQTALSLVLLFVSVGIGVLVAGRIYRVGIHMKGKRPNLPEVVRWIRHG